MRSIIFDVKFRVVAEKNPEGYSFILPDEVIEALKLEPGHNLSMNIQDDRRSIRDVFLLLEGGNVLLPRGTLEDGDDHKPVIVELHRLIRRKEPADTDVAKGGNVVSLIQRNGSARNPAC